MHVALPPDLEQLVTARVQSGRYSSVSEVIREALLLLEEREQRSEVRRQELRHIYRPETRPLEIVRIVHSARDIPHLL